MSFRPSVGLLRVFLSVLGACRAVWCVANRSLVGLWRGFPGLGGGSSVGRVGH